MKKARFYLGTYGLLLAFCLSNVILQAKPLYINEFMASNTMNVSSPPPTYTVNLIIPINAPNDDGEQTPGGSVTLQSSDIEMVQEGTALYTAGYRFNNIALPAGATVTNAYLQFYAKEVQTGSANINIFADAAANAAPFASTNNNFTSRAMTSSPVNWMPAPWPVINANGAAQQTPNLASTIQQVVGQTNWQSGNAIAIFMNGSGTRTTYAYNNSPSKSAVLHITAEVPLPTQPILPVFINELAAAGTTYADASGKFEDWIELYNPNATPVNLGGLFLTDNLGDLDKWQISGVVIPPNGFVTFFADGDISEGAQHTNFSLKQSGESVALVQLLPAGLTIIDQITFGPIPFQATYGRSVDGGGSWKMFGQITPNATNANALSYLSPPVFSLPTGFYSGTQTLILSHPLPGTTIYYTTDGSLPDVNALLYNDPISIPTTRSIRAIATHPGYANSQPEDFTYMVNENPNIPVVYLTTDPDNFFDDEIGIYVDGTNGVAAYCSSVPVNWAQDWERPCNLKMFLSDGTVAFDVNAGVEISGACSRSNAMKALGIKLREKDYGDGSLNYEIFPQRDMKDFQRFKIRGSGQDYFRLGFRDMLNQTLLFKDFDLEVQAGRTVLLYLNGEFWGIYNLREQYAGEHFQELYDVNEEDLDIIQSPGLSYAEIKDGTAEGYNALFTFMENANMNNQADFDYFKSQVDLEEFTNYWVAMTYMANYDWPANNLTIWRDRVNQTKWRYGVADTDGSTYNVLSSKSKPEYNTFSSINDATSTSWPNHKNSTLFFRKLLERSDYRNEFIQRTCTFSEVVFNQERTHPLIDSIVGLFQPNVQNHLNKWAFDNAMGGSVASWNSYIEKYKEFWEQRPAFMRQHMNDFYGLSNYYDLTINFNANTPGDVFVNTIAMSIPYNYTGTYFKNIPLQLKAVADPGYQFAYWLETGVTTATINFVGNTNTTLTPVFVLVGQNLTLTCPQNIAINALPGANSTTVSWQPPTPFTSCQPNQITLNQTAGPLNGTAFPTGTTTIQYTATDLCGNTVTCSFTITVTAVPSTISLQCPANITAAIPSGAPSVVVNWTAPVGTTNCILGAATTTQLSGPLSGTAVAAGVHVVTYRTTDACGTTTTCNFTVTVTDSSNTITLNCPANQNVVLPAGATNIIVTWSLPTVSSTCGGGTGNPNCGTTIPGFTSLGTFNNHQYYRSVNSEFWTVGKTICSGYGAHMATINDAAENAFVKNNISETSFIGLNDATTEGQLVWDNGEPLAYQNFSGTGSNSATNDYAQFQPWDGKWKMIAANVKKKILMELNCGSSNLQLTQIAGPANGTALAVGIYTITYQATDACGGLKTCSFTVTVQNNLQTISLSCPANQTLTAASGATGANVSWAAATGTTTCSTGGLTINQTGGAVNGSFFAIGNHTITYTATDNCSSRTCSFVITVLPNTPPGSYCVSSGSTPWQQWISNVSFNTINNNSAKNGYGNFTGISTPVNQGNTYAFSLTPAFSWNIWNEYVRVWIDYNKDFDFDDPGELVLEQISQAGTPPYVPTPVDLINGNITIPASALTGSTRMRVSMQKDAYAGPCEAFVFGEVEDYTVIINAGAPNPLMGEDAAILFFDAVKSGREVQLQWVTNTGYKNDYYVLEHSTDGTQFQVLANISNTDDFAEARQFQYTDKQPITGSNFYRLIQVYKDGSNRVSEMKRVDFDLDVNAIGLYPNPAEQEIYADLGIYAGLAAGLQINNSLGQPVSNLHFDALPAEPIRIDLKEMKAGVYYLSVKAENKKLITQKFVVMRR